MLSSPPVRRRLALMLTLAAAATVGLGALPAQADSEQPLTAAAKRAGVEPGNTRMGWRATRAAPVGVPPEAAPAQSVEPAAGLPAAAQPAAAQPQLSLAASSTAKVFQPPGVLGIDVSSHQGNVDWGRWTSAGRQFAFVKATEGTSYKNPYFAGQYNGAASAGLLRGAYHFANPAGKSGKTQARFFVKNGGGWRADGKTLPGVLDIEYNPSGKTCYGLSKTKMKKWIQSFTREYVKLTGRQAIIYTTTDWWTRCTGGSERFSRVNPLWVARYGTTAPGKLPGIWTKATFWQYTSTPIDQNLFHSTYDDLVTLARGSAQPKP